MTELRERSGNRWNSWLARRRTAAVCLMLTALTLATTADVLADGLLRHWDRELMLGQDGLRLTTGWQFWVWRTVVWGGQYWLVGSLACLLAGLVAVRRRRPWLFVAVGVWIGADQVAVWIFKKIIGRTFPGTGRDLLGVAGDAYPSGHSAIGASCLLVAAALVPALVKHPATRYAMPVALVLSTGAAVATVLLGYHWPTDAIAGWTFGTTIGLVGCAVVRRFE